jgi:imidazole glycerol-phosphate synthase subunit HisH
MKIAVIKYNAGNIQSLSFALERLGLDFKVTGDAEEISKADKVIFPGVGEASTTMKYLREHKLDQVIKDLKQPVFGICLGMQLLCRHSEENNTTCLGIFDDEVKRFVPKNNEKVPHMGWNTLSVKDTWLDPALENLHAYFVHSFYVPLGRYTSAQTNYVQPFSSGLRKNNFYAVQFHPEKSAKAGELVLQSFLKI